MPLEKSGSREAISRNISEMVASGHPRRQAIAAALHTADKYGKRASGGALAAGGSTGAPQAPTYKTAAPNVNSAGFVPVPQVAGNPYALDLNTGALTPGAQQALQNFAMRGLPGGPDNRPPPPAPASAATDPNAPQVGGINDKFNPNLPLSSGFRGTPVNLPSGTDPAQFEQNSAAGGGGEKRGGRIGRLAAGGGADPMVGYEQRHAEHVGLNRTPPTYIPSGHVPAGLVHTAGPGRTDNVNMTVAPGSHVIPSDVVAGLGQGNTLAGAHALGMSMQGGPGGITLPKGPHKIASMPKPPPAFHGASGGPVWEGSAIKVARGGAPRGIKCIVAGGEWIMAPHEVAATKHNGKTGHAAVNSWIMERRKGDVKTLRGLAPPVGMKRT